MFVCVWCVLVFEFHTACMQGVRVCLCGFLLFLHCSHRVNTGDTVCSVLRAFVVSFCVIGTRGERCGRVCTFVSACGFGVFCQTR